MTEEFLVHYGPEIISRHSITLEECQKEWIPIISTIQTNSDFEIQVTNFIEKKD